MRKGEGVALRIDDQMRAAIADLGKRLGTSNISAILRVGFMSGYREINALPSQLVAQSYREGVFQGVADVKARIEFAIKEVLSDG